MTTPHAFHPQPADLPLGTEGAYAFVQRGREVLRVQGEYCWCECSAARWPETAVARRIAGAQKAREQAERAVRETLRPEKPRFNGVRKF